MRMLRNRKDGFTLIESVLAIVVIAAISVMLKPEVFVKNRQWAGTICSSSL